MKKFLMGLSIVALLVGCGGANQTSDSTGTSEQLKQLRTSQKAVASDYAEVVQELYVAYFGRPADPAGLTNFENALLAAGAPTNVQGLASAYASNQTLQTLINSFGNSKESQNLYGSGTTANFVTAVFQNVLGRAPQQSGLSYWSNAISSGSLSQGNVALSIMAGALSNTTSQGQIDTQLINNRINIATYFTGQVSSMNATSRYSGSVAAASARAMLSGVSSGTVISSYEPTAVATISAFSSTGTACTSSNMTVANYNAISAGMSLAQVNQVVGCQGNSNSVTQSFVTYGWGSGASLIDVEFDPTGTTVTAVGGQYKSGVNLVFANSSGGVACSQSNLTAANYNAIALGMSLAQVNQVMGCQTNSNSITGSFVTFGWSYGASLINVEFDSTGSTVIMVGNQYKTSVNLNGSTTTATCTQNNLTTANYNAITQGMTLAQVNQIIGCQSNSNSATQSFVTYGWGYGDSLIDVEFDSTGTIVTAVGNQYKTAVNLSGTSSTNLPACTQSNMTVANYSAITAGMNLDQVNLAIGCQGSSSGVTQDFVTYGWGYGASLIDVEFDPTGTTVTAVGNQYKSGVNLTFANTPVAASCTQSNMTSANYNAIAAGMTLAQVNKVMGCQSNSNDITQSFVTFGWGYGASLINVEFDPTGSTVTAVGSQYKTAVNLN